MQAGKNYLIIDDDKSNNLLCKVILKKILGDVEIASFDNPREGLHYIQQEYGKKEVNKPTVLFLDINMPDISGWELLDIYKDFDEHIHSQFTICFPPPLTTKINPSPNKIHW